MIESQTVIAANPKSESFTFCVNFYNIGLNLPSVPGQKQWQIIDRVWGRVKDSAGQTVGVHDRDSAPVIQHNAGPAIQILGKERTPQVDTAANAIATQLERGVHQDSQGVNKKDTSF